MKKILIPENAGDLKTIDDMVQQSCDCEDNPKLKNTSTEAVVLRPNKKDQNGEWANWTVIDNRDHQCFTEDFATLDGAMIYASDLRTTCEGQIEWDAANRFVQELLAALEKRKDNIPDEQPMREIEQTKKLSVREILPIIRGNVTLEVKTRKYKSRLESVVHKWTVSSYHGGLDLLKIVQESPYVDSDMVLNSSAEIVQPNDSHDPCTIVETYFEEVSCS